MPEIIGWAQDRRMPRDTETLARRCFLRLALVTPLAFALAPLRWVGEAAATATRARRVLPITPDCDDGDEPTPAETEGPFYTPRSPERRSLIEPGTRGDRLVVTGRVFSQHCRPVQGALLDFWHADTDGEYDNVGFKLRGHQFTDADGRFRLETIVPGLYEPRTRHIHVKVQAPRGRVLTTQLYFPGEPRNREDGLFRSDLLMAMNAPRAPRQARFHFVLG